MMGDLAERYEILCKALSTSFKKCGYILRPRAGTGLWLIGLLPTALVLCTVKQILRSGERTLSHVYFASAVVSFGLLVTSVLYIMRFVPKYGHRIHNFYFAVPAIGTLLFLLFTQNGFLLSLLGGLMSTYGLLAGLPTLLTLAPSCFTLGEAVIVVQSLVIFLYSSAVNLCHVAFSNSSLLGEMDFSYEVATIILQTGMTFVLLMIAVLVACPALRDPPLFYVVLGAATLGTVVALHALLGGSPVLWILENFTRDHQTFNVLLVWLICSTIGGVVVVQHTLSQRKASTSDRKVFHVLAVIVFSCGILYAPDLLYLASGVCFAVFLLLEASRILEIPPLSVVLKDGFNSLSDEKDSLIALTPLYLLTGMSAPLWLSPSSDFPISPGFLLPYLAGVLSIGIGDTAASYVGFNYGRNKWNGTNRTIEGTMACFVSQVAVVLLLTQFDVLPADSLSIIRSLGALAIISLIEANTDQVDNVVLPLVLYILTY